LGKPFACKGCNAKLLIPRNYWIGLGAFVVFWRLKGRAESTAEILLLLVGLVIAVLMLSRLFLIPRKVWSQWPLSTQYRTLRFNHRRE